MMRKMSNLNMDSFSTTSVTSKNSDYRKAPRFSLRRIFFRRSKSRAYASAKTKLNTESDSHSDSSSVSQSIELTKDVATSRSQSASLVNVSPQPPFVVLMKKESADLVECPLCLQDQPYANFAVVMTCYHRSCRDCLRQYLRIEITESRIDISCPECAERYHPNDIRVILDDDNLMLKYEEFMLRRVLVADADTRWCPAPDCGYAVIAAGCASCPKLRCERPSCNTFFCYHCKQHWHPNQTCDAARAERSSNFRSVSVTNSHDSTTQSEIKPCPRCTAYITKMDDGSCNHMTCAVCGAEFCWLCMKEISDLHYLSPSGCTFWGKKPWSRKKKILWQLGTLIGAPVGIGLVAGIAVPAMIIGIPVWVGKKLHTRYGHLSLHKRNMVIASGVMASVVVSPVVASLAVSIGVPILLAYIYFVVPISLCRSGGCGVSTTDSGGVRFEFEEEHYTYGPTASDNHSIDTTSHRVANPSIGPSIGEMSMTMTGSLSASGSHLDRVGAIKDESDRESASNRAIAGCSLNGSLSGSACAGPVGFQNRLEVHADVLPSSAFNNKRSSFSSESANFSLSEKSGILFERDDISMRTMAGSLRDKDFKNATTVTPSLEVQADICQNRNRNLSGNSLESHRIPSTHGSPMSNRSVSFVNDEKQLHCFGKSKRNRSGSRSFGDKIHEDVETPHNVVPDSLSMHSFIDDELNSRVSNIGDSSSQSISLLGGTEFTAHLTYRDGNRQVPDLTEIESNFLDAPNQSKSKPFNNTARFTQGNQDVNHLHYSFSEKRNGDSCKSPSEIELTAVAASLSLTHATGHRRRSCEVALAEGRVTLDDTTFAV